MPVIYFDGSEYVDEIFDLFTGTPSRSDVATVLARMIDTALKQVHPDSGASARPLVSTPAPPPKRRPD